ncbi:MAG: GNAT family N-acetyltransferase [Candidatus Actinomarina sp.]|jgi:predicted GNAT superfamily acetyltransferase|tara:strand:+ start:516 stop:1025 length:510 start_codon:yes stop_codon:yes gene_type:complete
MKIIKIKSENLVECHRINQENTPEVGTVTLEELQNSWENSDYNLCAVVDDKVVGFVISFQDTKATNSYMSDFEHKNFNEISQRVSDFLYIDRIAVDKNYRKRSIGSKLYEEVVKFAEMNSISHLTAEINLLPAKNIPSFLFHEKFNFTELDTVKYSEEYKVSLQIRINN